MVGVVVELGDVVVWDDTGRDLDVPVEPGLGQHPEGQLGAASLSRPGPLCGSGLAYSCWGSCTPS